MLASINKFFKLLFKEKIQTFDCEIFLFKNIFFVLFKKDITITRYNVSIFLNQKHSSKRMRLLQSGKLNHLNLFVTMWKWLFL